MIYTKRQLCEMAINLIDNFCELNNIPKPKFDIDWETGTTQTEGIVCGHFTFGTDVLHLQPNRCANPNPNKDWPGFFYDRTCYGVMCHEFAHYVDNLSPSLFNIKLISTELRQIANEPSFNRDPKDDYEYFADVFKLFVTNPDLLRITRPSIFKLLTETYKLSPIILEDYRTVLNKFSAPNKIFERIDLEIKTI